MEKEKQINLKLDQNDHSKLIDLQVKFRHIKASGRISQGETLKLCINLIHSLPSINKCKHCQRLIAGIGFCSIECENLYYGRLNDSNKG